MRRSTIIAATATSLASAVPPQAANAQHAPAVTSRSAALADAVDAVVQCAIAEQRLVGAVVLIAQDGRIIYHRAAGHADREANRPMREGAVFRLASLTKPFVSAAVLALVDRGVLGLDDPVTRWLPSFRPRTTDGREPVITVRQLLTHTAGLTYGFFQPADGPYVRAGVSDGFDDPDITLDENLRRLAGVPLSYEPGAAWGYSLAHDVLGAVVARAAGAPLPDAVRTLVTAPLGITDADFLVHDASRLATPYADGRPEPIRMHDPEVVSFAPWGATFRFSPARALSADAFPSGGGGMVGTARDMLTLLEALRSGGGPVLRPATAAAMTHNAIGDLRSNPGWGFGQGVAVLLDPREAATPQSPGTFMWGGIYGHSWFVDPARQLTVVALTNTAVEGMAGAFPSHLRDAVYAAMSPR